jgi:hypothetical protein
MKIDRCRCGAIITGTSEKHLKYNMSRHLSSETHRRNLRIIKKLEIKKMIYRLKRKKNQSPQERVSKNNISADDSNLIDCKGGN